MIYLDYSATTPVNNDVLDTFNKVSLNYIGNANSFHKLGLDSKKLLDEATNQIGTILKIDSKEIIYTSGATESNNLAIKGICSFYNNRGNHIITTKLEHSSVIEPIKYLEKKGFLVSYVNLLPNGMIDINHLKSLITKDTLLVSINHVNSELGIKQPVEEIGQILKAKKTIIFHVDGTQALGKINIDLANIDLYSFSAHKFYGLKGIGCLIKKRNIKMEPLFHGGRSINEYRSGTPMLPLVVSMAKALRLVCNDVENNYKYILNLNQKIKKNLMKYKNIDINSNDECLPHILNISIKGIKPETFIRAMEKHNIYISTKSACSNLDQASAALLALNKDALNASSSIRISLSHLTTNKEIESFLTFFDKEYNELKFIEKEQ